MIEATGCPECGAAMESDGDRYACAACVHRGEQLTLELRRERKNRMSENKEFALQLAEEKLELDQEVIKQLKCELGLALHDAKTWMKKAKRLDGFVRYECEGCGRGFAVDESNDNELNEPACPECGGTDCNATELPR